MRLGSPHLGQTTPCEQQARRQIVAPGDLGYSATRNEKRPARFPGKVSAEMSVYFLCWPERPLR